MAQPPPPMRPSSVLAELRPWPVFRRDLLRDANAPDREWCVQGTGSRSRARCGVHVAVGRGWCAVCVMGGCGICTGASHSIEEWGVRVGFGSIRKAWGIRTSEAQSLHMRDTSIVLEDQWGTAKPAIPCSCESAAKALAALREALGMARVSRRTLSLLV